LKRALVAGISVGALSLALLVTGASAEPSSGQDVRASVSRSVTRYFSAYNQSLYYSAASFVGRSATRRCGGFESVTAALQRNARAERIRYSLVRLRITAVRSGGRVAEADVYVKERDATTGRILNTIGLGLRFVRESAWKFADLFPSGASSFCR
jgi:hypothetical protein